jgi:hypothetical protein
VSGIVWFLAHLAEADTWVQPAERTIDAEIRLLWR